MDRTAANAYLTSEYAELATDANFVPWQATQAYTTAIDMSLRQLGFTETDLPTANVSQSSVLAYIALLNYYALKRFERLLSVRVDVQIQDSFRAFRSQASKEIARLLKDVEKELLTYGIQVKGAIFEMGRLNLDFNEPGLTGELANYDSFYGF